MSYSEVKSLPIRYRRWYLDRLVRHFKEQKEAYNKDSDSSSDNNLDNFNAFANQVNSKLT